MDTLTIFTVQFVLSLVIFSLAARWYFAPRLAGKPMNDALSILLLPHAFRHIGLVFLVPGLVGENLPRDFAAGAAYGDFASGLLALASILALRGKLRFALVLVAVTNLVGVIDLVVALSQATVIPQLGVAWFIPTFIVPALLVTHGMMLSRLYGMVRGHFVPDVGHSSRRGATS